MKTVGEGFRPTLGAGSDAISAHFGTPVLVLYLSSKFGTALNYPMVSTIEGIKGVCKIGVNGGTLIADDGTHPLRIVLRVLADRRNYI